MDISKESFRVLLDLLDIEPKSIVLPSRRVLHTSDKAILRPMNTPHTASNPLTAFYGLRVRERNTRRSGLAFDRFVDVGRGGGGGLVIALEAGKGDVVADDVFFGVKAESVQARGAFEAAGEGVVGVDDLVGCREDGVGGGEGEGAVSGDWAMLSAYGMGSLSRLRRLTIVLVASPLLAPVLAPDGGGGSRGDHGGGNGEGEFHFGGWGCWVGCWEGVDVVDLLFV
jgi:hypothetical protein